MTVQLSQIQAAETRLFPETSVQNQSDNSFQHYLDDEQKRLVLMFSPFGQANFNSWFAYPDFSAVTDPGQTTARLFSDLEPTQHEHQPTTKSPARLVQETGRAAPAQQPFSQLSSLYFNQQSQPILSDLLLKTGWLTPNIAARPDMMLAQLDGKLLSKVDLQSLVDQIVDQVKLVQDKGKTELSFGLRQDSLGQLLLTLTARSGMISIEIQANDEIKKLLQAQLRDLEIALKRAKVNVADIKVVGAEEVSHHA